MCVNLNEIEPLKQQIIVYSKEKLDINEKRGDEGY